MTYNLFYPASLLPHKNHRLLLDPELLNYLIRNEIKVSLTVDSHLFPSKTSGSLVCLGRLDRDACIAFLRQSDALLFLSEYESLGLPLIEAANARKPVICFDLPYSRELLGDSPYYIQHDFRGDNPICCALARFLFDQPNPRQSALMRETLPISTVWRCFLNAI